ncbi:MAG TPA: lipid-A-disaccharide synthase [Pirellulales bacterium]|jgi:lipid-A-disaccharide synthase|nr:lipid-A-disaccharide synthase [Pirellulales bacterium]
MKIFFSVGEPSGDLHGANLIRALRDRRPDVQCLGYGGPLMAEAGCQLHEDLTRLAVMWVLRVLLNLHRFLELVSRADRYFQHHRPDAVVLIDYPGFNWWIARRAKAHGIPVFYFAPPQVWAWGGWRIKKMRRFVDHVLCGLKFEADWYAARGCNATFVGHPYFDEVREHPLDIAFVERLRAADGPLVTILPGSRTQEVEHNLRWFLKAAAMVRQGMPNVRFALAAFKPHQARWAQQAIAASGLKIEVYLRRTPELIAAAHCCMAVSGSVSLELLYHRRPTVILYWITRSAFWLQRKLRRVRYITLVNLLVSKQPFFEHGTQPPCDRAAPPPPADERVLFPEYLTCGDRSAEIAEHVVDWLAHPAEHTDCVARLDALRTEVAHGGATRTAAAYIVDTLDQSHHHRLPRPHYLPGMNVASSGLQRKAAP